MKLPGNGDEMPTNEVETDLHTTVLTAELLERGTTPYDGALTIAGWLMHNKEVYYYIWNNCETSLESRVTVIRRSRIEPHHVEDLGRSWIYDFVATNVQGNLVQVAIDCMLNDFADIFDDNDLRWPTNLVWTPSDMGEIDCGWC